MKKSLLLLTFFLCVFSFSIQASGNVVCANSNHSSALSSSSIQHSASFKKKRPNLFLFRLKKRVQRTKRVTAALLAFPLPFGVLALHRIYLGTKPYVPVVYIATIGGILGILPFIDFCVLLMDSNADRYYNNSKVFMWIK